MAPNDKPKVAKAPFADDLLRHAQLKRTSSTSSQLPQAAPRPTETPSRPLKKPKVIELSEDFCNYNQGTASIKPQLHQFLFPNAEAYLRNFNAADVLAESSSYNILSL